jgi:cation transport ATPase
MEDFFGNSLAVRHHADTASRIPFSTAKLSSTEYQNYLSKNPEMQPTHQQPTMKDDQREMSHEQERQTKRDSSYKDKLMKSIRLRNPERVAWTGIFSAVFATFLVTLVVLSLLRPFDISSFHQLQMSSLLASILLLILTWSIARTLFTRTTKTQHFPEHSDQWQLEHDQAAPRSWWESKSNK